MVQSGEVLMWCTQILYGNNLLVIAYSKILQLLCGLRYKLERMEIVDAMHFVWYLWYFKNIDKVREALFTSLLMSVI